MAIKDLESNVKANVGIVPLLRTASVNGSGVDTKGYSSASVVFNFGDWTDGTWTPSLEDSADGTTYTTVAAANLQGSFTAVSGTAGENTVQHVGYKGAERYVRPVLSGTGTTGAAASAIVLLGHAELSPV